MQKSKFLAIIIAATLVLSLFFTAGCGEDTDTATITFIQGDWTSHMVITEIVAQIAEELGYKTEKIAMSVTAGWGAISRGDADISVEAWLPSRVFEVQPYIDNGTLELGSLNFTGSIEWFVPRYVIEGDPDRGIEATAPGLRTILDLKEEQYWTLFENPENPGKAELMGGDPGWIDDANDRMRIIGYDLPLWRSNQSESVLCARIISQFERGRPFLTYMWTPHWIFSVVDLVALEEVDPWFEDAFEDETRGYRSAHALAEVYTAMSPGLRDKAPEIYRLLQNINIGFEGASDLQYRVDVLEEDYRQVATDWISENRAAIDRWLSQ